MNYALIVNICIQISTLWEVFEGEFIIITVKQWWSPTNSKFKYYIIIPNDAKTIGRVHFRIEW